MENPMNTNEKKTSALKEEDAACGRHHLCALFRKNEKAP